MTGTAGTLGRFVVMAGVLLCLPARAQSVRVAPGRTTLALGETVTVQIVLGGQFDEARGPDIPDFDVVGKSSGSSISIVNGAVSQEQQINLTLAPKKAGNLTFGAIELVSGGRVIASSKPVVLHVLAKGGVVTPSQGGPTPPPVPAPGQGPAAAQAAEPPVAAGPAVPEKYAGSRYFVLARVPEGPLYVGQPVYVEYVLYAQAGVGIADVQIESAPVLKGFVVLQPRGNPPGARRVSVGGVPYDMYVLWRGAVTALGPGRAVLPSISAVVAVGDGFFVQRRRAQSEAVAVDFEAVPTASRPADFLDGTVGRFDVKASLDKTTLRVGDSAVLTVEVSGGGNLQAVRAPDLRAPDGLRISRVPASDLDETVVDVGGVSGRRTFQYLLSPEREGDFDVGRVELPFFDPIARKYGRSRTEPLKLNAVGGRGGPIQEVRGGQPVVSFIAQSDLAAPPQVAPLTGVPLLAYAGLALPVALYAGAEALARRRSWLERHGVSLARRRALRVASAALAAIAKHRASSPAEFWGAVDGVLRDFVALRFGIAAAGLTYDELRTALATRGVARELQDLLVAELENCAFGRFAPSAALERDRAGAVGRVQGCIEALDRTREPT